MSHCLPNSTLLLALIVALGVLKTAAQPAGISASGADAAIGSTSLSASPSMTADEIVARLMEANSVRARNLQSYTGKRFYSLDYEGLWGHKQATLDVLAQFTSPSTKEFTIISESGSKVLLNRVLKKLLEGEKEASDPENQRRTALSPENYEFTLLGTKVLQSGPCYRLKVEPHHDNKFLYRGEVCVDQKDFAVASIDAEPSKNPSFWTSSVQIEHLYVKVGQFWLPASNKSVTKVKLGGTAVMTIEYTGYSVN